MNDVNVTVRFVLGNTDRLWRMIGPAGSNLLSIQNKTGALICLSGTVNQRQVMSITHTTGQIMATVIFLIESIQQKALFIAMIVSNESIRSQTRQFWQIPFFIKVEFHPELELNERVCTIVGDKTAVTKAISALALRNGSSFQSNEKKKYTLPLFTFLPPQELFFTNLCHLLSANCVRGR